MKIDYVNNTDINFTDIGLTITQIANYYKKNKNVPDNLKDIIQITEWQGRLIIDWA